MQILYISYISATQRKNNHDLNNSHTILYIDIVYKKSYNFNFKQFSSIRDAAHSKIDELKRKFFEKSRELSELQGFQVQALHLIGVPALQGIPSLVFRVIHNSPAHQQVLLVHTHTEVEATQLQFGGDEGELIGRKNFNSVQRFVVFINSTNDEDLPAMDHCPVALSLFHHPRLANFPFVGDGVE